MLHRRIASRRAWLTGGACITARPCAPPTLVQCDPSNGWWQPLASLSAGLRPPSAIWVSDGDEKGLRAIHGAGEPPPPFPPLHRPDAAPCSLHLGSCACHHELGGSAMVPLMRVARSIPPRAHATTFVYTFRSAHSHRRLLPVHYQFPRGHVCPPVRRVWSCGLRRGCQASTAIAYSFNREFGPVIKRQINYFSKTGGSGGDKMAAPLLALLN